MMDPQSINSRLLASWEARAGRTMNGRLQGAREMAIARFKEVGLPAPRSEAWKYTPIQKFLDKLPELEIPVERPSVSAAQVATLDIAGLDAFRAVLVDGRFDAALSDLAGLPAGFRVTDLTQASGNPAVLEKLDKSGDAARDGFADLNSAFVQDGLLIEVDPGTVVSRPLLVLHVTTATKPTLVQPRILGIFGRDCQVQLAEICRSLGTAAVFVNSMSEYFTASGAVVDHVRLLDEHADVIHVNNLRSYQEGASNFATNVITLSGGVVRNQSYFLPDGEHCETHLSGFYLARDGAHVDNHTLVDHAKPECYSNELFKGILSNGGVGIFNGKVLVRQDAQKINAYQSNKSVVLDDSARVYSKPELEIYADDVRCSHGATTGELDKEAMFYLQARGIKADTARLILLEAFAADVLDRIKLVAVREHVDALVRERLSRN